MPILAKCLPNTCQILAKCLLVLPSTSQMLANNCKILANTCQCLPSTIQILAKTCWVFLKCLLVLPGTSQILANTCQSGKKLPNLSNYLPVFLNICYSCQVLVKYLLILWLPNSCRILANLDKYLPILPNSCQSCLNTCFFISLKCNHISLAF